MTTQVNLNELEYVKSDNNFTDEEMNKFDGTRVKVDKVETKLETTKFGEDGKPLPEGQLRETMVVVLTTAPVKMSSVGTPVTVVEKFSLKKHKTQDKWVASLHEKSKTYKLFRKYGKNTFPEFVGSEIILSKKIRQNGSPFLGISLG